MNNVRTAVLAILLFSGCSCAQTSLPSVPEAEQILQGDSLQIVRDLEGLTNIRPLPADQSRTPIPPPKSAQAESSHALEDLGIVLRTVKFAQPINGRRELLFSEAEITNRQFAAYLHDTAQQRDDTEIVQTEERRSQGTTTVNADGSTTTSWSYSTGSPTIGIQQPAMHWKGGSFPAGQEDFPVTFLTTPQARKFCTWLTERYSLAGSFRLPSDKEWLAAAYGETRKYPWGDDQREWTGKSSEPVLARPELRTPEGLYGMWGNVSELVLSASDGYGGQMPDFRDPMVTKWLGTTYEDQQIRGERTKPRQDYWGYTHSNQSRSDTWGFRIVFVSIKN